MRWFLRRHQFRAQSVLHHKFNVCFGSKQYLEPQFNKATSICCHLIGIIINLNLFAQRKICGFSLSHNNFQQLNNGRRLSSLVSVSNIDGTVSTHRAPKAVRKVSSHFLTQRNRYVISLTFKPSFRTDSFFHSDFVKRINQTSLSIADIHIPNHRLLRTLTL